MHADLQGMQQTLFSCNGIWKEPEFDETSRQQNFLGLFTTAMSLIALLSLMPELLMVLEIAFRVQQKGEYLGS